MRTLLIVVLAFAALLVLLQAGGLVDVGSLLERGDAPTEVVPLEAPGTPGQGAALQGAAGAGRAAGMGTATSSEARGSVPRGARIVGRVVEAGAAPQPIAGARVRLLRLHPITRYLETPAEGRWDLLEAVSDPTGRFVFSDVRPARGYTVRAQVAGRPAATSERLDLSVRQVVDLGDLVLLEPGELRGRLLDGAGQPIQAARVAVTWRVETILGMVLYEPELLPEIEAQTLSDEHGRFSLPGLEPGPKTLVIATREHGGKVLGKPHVDAGLRVDLGDIVLDGRGVVGGRVEWEDGTPVVGARVFSGEPKLDRPTLSSALTVADGSFRIEHLEGEAARLGVFVPGIPIQPSEDVPLGTLDVVLRLPLAGSLHGRVVRRTDGRPVTRFGVRLVPKDAEGWMARAVRTLVDGAAGPLAFEGPQGTFRIPFQARGKYVAVVRADGFPEQSSAPFDVPARGTVDVGTIELAEGHALGGTVRSSLGPPLAGAEIWMLSGNTDLRVDRADLLPDGLMVATAPDATADGEGRFSLPPQTPGKIALFVRHPHGVHRAVGDIDLTAGPRTDVEVVLEAAGEVRVRVLDARGRPAAHVDVQLVRPDGFAQGVDTAEDGSVRFTAIPVGPCLVRAASLREVNTLFTAAYTDDVEARAAAYEALRREVGEEIVRAGEVREVLLRLPARTDLTLRVRPWAPDLPPLASASVKHKGSYWRRHVFADEPGLFRLPLEPGEYEVRVFPESGWDDSKVFDLLVPDAPSHAADLGG